VEELKRKAVLVPALALIVLAMIMSTPAYACTANHSKPSRIQFTSTLYIVAYSPPTNTWYTDNNEIIHSTGSVTTLMSADGLTTEVTNGCYYEFNFLTGKGHSTEKWVVTFADSPIGKGTIEGIELGSTAVSNNYVGTGVSWGYGSTDKYRCVTESATTSWEPGYVPGTTIPTIVLTVTGTFTCTG
jgi:hypothetical protein